MPRWRVRMGLMLAWLLVACGGGRGQEPQTPAPIVAPTIVVSSLPTPSPTSAAPQWPAQVFAPYLDVTRWPTSELPRVAAETGVRYYTLAFITDGGNGHAAWGRSIPIGEPFLLDEIASLRRLGGDVIVSFGGGAGRELAQVIPTVEGLQAEYQAVIDRYDLTRIDFDVEGQKLADEASVDRRNQAIAGLQKEARARGRELAVSYTLPASPKGLGDKGLALLQNAIKSGVDIGLVNVMAMDYGAGPDPYRMGEHALGAANGLFAQLKGLYPDRADGELWAMVGVTPMIGLNDSVPEVFTLDDARQLLGLAQEKGIGLLAMWSVGRDRPCEGINTVAGDCSGIEQEPWAFTSVWKAFGGGG